MHALRQEILPPSGVEFATSLKLTPSTLTDQVLSTPPGSSARHELAARALCNLVVARTSLLRIFEVRKEPAPLPPQDEDDKDRMSKVRKGTEAVEGEVAMDEQGDGFVNLGPAKLNGAPPPTVTQFYFVREHCLHGIVTGLESIKTMASIEDKLDRLLVSFKDAKVALLEWSDAVHDLITVSIHTYERAPQLMSMDTSLFRADLRVDPMSRCAALSLPQDAMAILPFHQTQAELGIMDQDQASREVPYSPSFILDLATEVDEHIRNVIDFVFLPGFNNPTIAVLFQVQQTWTGRLKEFKDTVRLMIFTMDLATHNYPVITSVDGLPHDCISLLPCASSLGGVVILASNSVIYVDQTSRRVALPVNGWPSRISDLTMLPVPPGQETRDLALEGARGAFVDDKTLFVVLKDGTLYPIDVVAEGKTVSKLTMGAALAQTTIPTVVRRVDNEHLFIGSTVAPSVLLKAAHVEEEVDYSIDSASEPTTVVDIGNAMVLDDDDDLYGDSQVPMHSSANGLTNGTGHAKKQRMILHLSLCDSLPAYGPISDMTFSLAKNGDRPVPELVAATGSGALGGFTLFQRDLPSRTKRKLHAIGGARGMWSLSLKQSVKVNGVSVEKAINPYHTANDSIILATDANPSPGSSRIATKTARGDINITTRMQITTIGAAPFFQRTAILHVVANAICVLEPDGSSRQKIQDVDGNLPRAKIRACSICDPYVLVFREDDSIGLFIDTERGKIRRKDMSPMGDKFSRYIAGCFYTDTSGIFEAQLHTATGTNGVDKNATSTIQAAVNQEKRSQWLILVRPQGIMEIWSLPKLTLVYSNDAISSLQNVLVDSLDVAALSLPQDPPRKPQELDIDQILIAPLGESSPRPHLFVFLRSGQLAVYEALPTPVPSDFPTARTSFLPVKFVKLASHAFDIRRQDEMEKTVLAEQKRISRALIPFVTSPSPGTTYSGIFLTGDKPNWIISTNKGGIKVIPSGHAIVHSFTTCSLWESKGDFLLYTDEGPSLLEWMPDLQLSTNMPSRSVPRPRSYAHVVFEPTTSLIIACASLQSRFASYDEDSNIVWEPDAPNVSFPLCDCSTLEVISPDLWVTMDGYEFAMNEYVNTLEVVSLETLSTESGIKEFIAVGTTIDRGEDLAVKGAVYIFELVEVVSDPHVAVKRWYKLKLRARDDSKGPVTAVCGLNGYLVSSMGQKIFVRAFDLDERLVGVAFLDVGVYVTSLRTLKNLLLIGDVVKSVWFVAFQEDPFKLVVLAKDIRRVAVANIDFFFSEGMMSIVTGDDEGVLRIYDYNPGDPESKNGQHLLCRTEFHGQSESHTSAVIARRSKEEHVLPQAKIISGSTDGSLSSLTPVDESVYKRLQLLQGQLTRNIQHFAGLNPKAFRIVRNDYVSKPLTKGILDGNLLSAFESLPITGQNETTRQIGTDRTIVLRDWTALSTAW